MDSELNAFLFAEIGENKTGAVLTVVSALARSGIDPWAEAGRLAALTPGAAAQVLMPMIARSADAADLGDVRAIADRLVRLLPKGSATSQVVRPLRKQVASPPAAIWLVCLVVALGFLAWTVKEKSVAVDESPAGVTSTNDAPRQP